MEKKFDLDLLISDKLISLMYYCCFEYFSEKDIKLLMYKLRGRIKYLVKLIINDPWGRFGEYYPLEYMDVYSHKYINEPPCRVCKSFKYYNKGYIQIHEVINVKDGIILGFECNIYDGDTYNTVYNDYADIIVSSEYIRYCNREDYHKIWSK